jgi:hypothetical protein
MDRSKPAKRIGRPTKPPVEGERVPLGLRVTAEAKRKLEEAAIKSGRSISQEAELRIERSFDEDRIEDQFKGLRTDTFQIMAQWMEHLLGPDSAPTQSRERSQEAKMREDFLHAKKRREKKREELSDEELRQFRQDEEKALIERRKKWDAEVARVRERFEKEMEARYGPSKGDKTK